MCIFNLYQRVTFGPGILINFSTRQGLSTIPIWKKIRLNITEPVMQLMEERKYNNNIQKITEKTERYPTKSADITNTEKNTEKQNAHMVHIANQIRFKMVYTS